MLLQGEVESRLLLAFLSLASMRSVRLHSSACGSVCVCALVSPTIVGIARYHHGLGDSAIGRVCGE
jgi:hypothetical protein